MPADHPPPSHRHRSRRQPCAVALADSDLLTRTSWVDAAVAYRQVKRGRAYGNSCALWIRMQLQTHLFSLGCFIQKRCGIVIFLGLLLLSLCCIGLKTSKIETNVEQLWVEEGGRLQKELAYTEKVLGEGYGFTNELIIQTPKTGSNILSQQSLLLHFQAVLAATKVSIYLYDTTWKFRDLCLAMNFPNFDDPFIDRLMEPMLPCVIVTPLDCFWEGSKLLGPEYGRYIPNYSVSATWANLNPKDLVEKLRQFGYPQSDYLNEILESAGIGSGYQEKPCLDPNDIQCPLTAPNKESKQVPDIGAELTGGCNGVAAKYMHWDEELIVGGIHRNKSGSIVKAEALQSVIQLMGERELYEFWRDDTKTLSIDWTQESAKVVLNAWQRAFTQELDKVTKRQENESDNLLPFSTTSLLDLLKDFSQVSIVRVALGYVFMIVYACVCLLKWTDPVQSQSGIGLLGVLLVSLSVAAGLGICSVIGIHFNASTTQIIPFLALGVGVDDMFLIAHTFSENANRREIEYMEQTGHCLKRTGVSVMLTSISNMCAFFLAAIIPIPALRAFALQAGILVLFNMMSVLVVFPAFVSVDLYRRKENKVDVFCCFTGSETRVEMSPPPEYRESLNPPPYSAAPAPPRYHTITETGPGGAVTILASPTPRTTRETRSSSPVSTDGSQQHLTYDEEAGCNDQCAVTGGHCCRWTLTWFATHLYAPLLQKTWVKVLVVLGFTALLAFGIIGTTRVKDGLDLTDVVPRDTKEYHFLEAQDKYFGFYNMYAVTKADFDYPKNQELLYEYHVAFQRVEHILKREDGTLPEFWLKQMKDWLLDMQEAFDRDVRDGTITMEGWLDNATDDGILGYQLLLQTGNMDHPTDKQQVMINRLVDNEGIINRAAFYNYLTAWVSTDAMAYAACQANFHPVPKPWNHDPNKYDMRIPKSQPLVYAQIPFYLVKLGETELVIGTIEKIRGICETFSERGLPNYPSGIPFTFWEQYINLRFYLMLALVCTLGAIFLVLTIILCNPWAAVIVVAVLAMMVVELFGFMGLTGIKLSAVPAVTLIISVGIGVEFTVHIVLGFVTSIGSRNKRMRMTLEHMFTPVVHGAVSTFLGVVMLCGSEFDFIIKYFFLVLTVLVVLGLLNGLVLLPVLLSIVGPKSEVLPLDEADHISPPTPEPSPPPPPRPMRSVSCSSSHHRPRTYPRRVPSDISLSTISEEPTQYSSHEIVFQPEVVVETTTYPSGASTSVVHSNSSSSGSSTPPSSSSVTSSSGHHVTTTVKATAKVKVNVHTPRSGYVDQEHIHKSRIRKSQEAQDSVSDSEDTSTC